MIDMTFHALADPTRRAFLAQLADGPRAAGQLIPPHPISQPGVSRHLRVLRESGLVRASREGRRQMYSLVPERLRSVAEWIGHFERFWDDRLGVLALTLDDMARQEGGDGP